MKPAVTRRKLKAHYKHTSLCSSATLLQQSGISYMELSRVSQYIFICTVLHGLIWSYVFVVCLYAKSESDCDTGCT